MKPSVRLSAPIITFLAPSTAAAARACERLGNWTLLTKHHKPDTITKWGVTWEVRSLACSQTGTRIQYMASMRSLDRPASGNHILLALQEEARTKSDEYEQLFAGLGGTKSSARLLFSDWIRRPISAQALLGSGITPFLQVMESQENDSPVQPTHGVLKEVVLPYFDAGRPVLDQLARLPRIATGLYQLGNGLALRPLPASQEDHALPPPSLIFHSAAGSEPPVEQDQALVAKIGCSGTNRQGQTMVRHADTRGIDIRFCPSLKPSSMFCEAQESLLASSLDELQSTSVLKSTGKVDPKTLQTDCWVEFRANMTRPMGFWKKTQPKIAKAPDLPYEKRCFDVVDSYGVEYKR